MSKVTKLIEELHDAVFGQSVASLKAGYDWLKKRLPGKAKDKAALEGIEGLKRYATKRNASEFAVGKTVTLGNYGGEPVEWLVLAAEGDKRTLIAVKGQDSVSFAGLRKDGDWWERSYIRSWLNDTYYNTAFSAEEKAMITAGPTGDKVWLLSLEEARQYFADDDARVCCPNVHTENHGGGWWWLRSPSSDPFRATAVDDYGRVDAYGYGAKYICGMVRPVVVVALGLFN